MTTEAFSKRIVASGLLDIYVATSFFATLIFFVLNSNVYTPLEMISGVVLVTIAFKSVANMVLSMTISLVNLENEQDAIEFEKSSSKLESLVSDLAIQEASVQSMKNSKE
ncbi:MAG: hypothetical protein U9R16_01780 [Campylobacterota bacterium]|nr:hypothetical protein [Campylobacterota bacterium]